MIFKVTDVKFQPCKREQRASGLRGWATITVNGLILDSLQIRRTQDGRNVITLPTRVGASGSSHPYYRTADSEAQTAIETQVIAELRARGFVE